VTPASGAPAPREDDSGWYLYGVVSAGAAPSEVQRPAVDPRHGVTVLAEGSLAGVTSRVSLAEFDETALPQRLNDTQWLEQRIRAHEQVLDAVLATASVVPCRFCTVYRSEDDLREFLSDRGDVLAQALDRVEGRVELGVKAYVDRDRFAEGAARRDDSIRELSERVERAEGGRAYLERRRLEQLVSDELARFTAELAARLQTQLLGSADDGVPLALQRPELSGREEEMLFNGAYLVSDAARFEQELTQLADEHRDEGVEIELTGPWPPYNFVPAELGAS
jgi:gas vesicle protein GvpL/GvpF